MSLVATHNAECAQQIHIGGLVQGVGFRPAVWRLARRLGLRGTVRNDGQGVLVHVCGPGDAVARFVQGLKTEAPPLSRVERIDCQDAHPLPADAGFTIAPSIQGTVRTGVAPDAASCAACVAEVFDASGRRHRYPFTNCTHCGPRLSIVQGIPYDRSSTTMRGFAMCQACRDEYENPDDRRFHAQPIACPDCGPRAWLVTAHGADMAPSDIGLRDALEAAGTLLLQGAIIAIKGLGGFQLACDATDAAAVDRLRLRKQRAHKPFALMARDMEQVRRYCAVSDAEENQLRSAAAPIVLLARRPDAPTDTTPLAGGVAPALSALGIMLPNSPLHHLILAHMAHPIVLTSGNRSGEPQQTDNRLALQHLGTIADHFLLHDRDVARRVDDSVLRVLADKPHVMRRARGMAPAAITLPPGFDAAPSLLALGGEVKNSFCLLQGGKATLSHHIGDLEEATTHADFQQAIQDYLRLFDHTPTLLVVDRHPEYLSGKFARAWCDAAACNPDGNGMALVEVGHHHAHLAACMAENGVALDAPAIIGVALDGLGYGDHGELWGGEFFHVDYRHCRRLARCKPVALLGGAMAMHGPWRSTYAHLMDCIGWQRLAREYGALALVRRLDTKPRALLDSMLRGNVNSPLASSCGRLFDAVAAACGVCFEHCTYEGQAAIEFEALADGDTLACEDDARAYPFAIGRNDDGDLPRIDPLPMWQALLNDLQHAVATPVMAARFHKGLAIAVTQMVRHVADGIGVVHAPRTVALSGGVFQNRILLEQVTRRLTQAGFSVLSHQQVPANDGGLSFGQAAVAAARALAQPAGRHNGL
jgi:hydrogenase maturation protein HypF